MFFLYINFEERIIRDEPVKNNFLTIASLTTHPVSPSFWNLAFFPRCFQYIHNEFVHVYLIFIYCGLDEGVAEKIMWICMPLFLSFSLSPPSFFDLWNQRIPFLPKTVCFLPLQVSAVTALSMTCPKIVPYPGCGGSCTVSRSKWGSLRLPSNLRNSQQSPPSLWSPQHMQGSEVQCLAFFPPIPPHSSLYAWHIKSHISFHFHSCLGLYRRPNWLVCLRPSSMFLSFTGLWWKTHHTRHHWWLNSWQKVAWPTLIYTCPLPRTANCRRLAEICKLLIPVSHQPYLIFSP